METVLGRLRGGGGERAPRSRGARVALVCLGLLALAVVGLIVGRLGDGTGQNDNAASSAAAPASSAAYAASTAAAETAAAPASSAAAEAAVTEAAAPDAAGLPPSPGARDLPVAPRIAQTGSITLRVPAGSLDQKIDEIGIFAEQENGYVAGTEADLGGKQGRGQATVTVRVPQERYAKSVQHFARLGTVIGRQSSSEDLTQDYVDTGSRLRHAKLVEARLVALLDEAKTVNETLAIQGRLDDVQLRIETDRGRLDNLTRVTSYATLSINLVTAGAEPVVAAVKPDDRRPWGLRSALEDAAHNVADTVAVMTRGLGVILPLLALAAFGWIVWRIVRRTSRRPTEAPPTT